MSSYMKQQEVRQEYLSEDRRLSQAEEELGKGESLNEILRLAHVQLRRFLIQNCLLQLAEHSGKKINKQSFESARTCFYNCLRTYGRIFSLNVLTEIKEVLQTLYSLENYQEDSVYQDIRFLGFGLDSLGLYLQREGLNQLFCDYQNSFLGLLRNSINFSSIRDQLGEDNKYKKFRREQLRLFLKHAELQIEEYRKLFAIHQTVDHLLNANKIYESIIDLANVLGNDFVNPENYKKQKDFLGQMIERTRRNLENRKSI